MLQFVSDSDGDPDTDTCGKARGPGTSSFVTSYPEANEVTRWTQAVGSFSTKPTNDTKPNHATLAQAVTPGPEGRKTVAHLGVSRG